MNRKGQFSIIAALLVAIVLVSTVIMTYSIILNSTIQVQPQVLSAIDETNFALKQMLGFAVGYFGSVIKVTGDLSYANESTLNYTASGLAYIANTHADWGAGFALNNLTMHTEWFNKTSYSTGYLDVTYNLTKLGIYGVRYTPSAGLTAQITNTTVYNQTSLVVTGDENKPIIDLTKQNFKFYQYVQTNSTWQSVSPTTDPSLENGTYLIDIPPEVSPQAYVVEVQDQRGITTVASSFNQYTYAFNFTGYNFTLPNSAWWNPAYSYRKLITITNNAAATIGSGYSVMATVDTASLVSTGKMRMDGSDLRIVNWNGSAWVELDRDIINMDSSSTQVWFKTQASISSSPSTDNNYYLYYGNPSAVNPPANKSNVYLWFDDFNRADKPDITTEPAYIKTNGGTWSIQNGMLKNVGAGGDPNKLIVNALGSLTQDVEIVAKIDVAQFGGGDAGRMGLSSNMDPSGSGYCALFYNDQNTLSLLNDLRSWGTQTAYSWTTNTWYYMKFRVISSATNNGKVKVWPVGSSEPSSWTIDGNFGSGQTRGYGMVGIGGSRQGDITYFDDLLIRYIVNPEPSIALGQEETSPGLPRPASQTQGPPTVIEVLQNGAMQWLGQNVNLTPGPEPIIPLPVKSIHVNQTTIDNVTREVPFQIEDWSSNYTVPIGLTDNASIFSGRNMLVFLVYPNVVNVTIWWDGSETAVQTPLAYTCTAFTGDNVNAGILTNGGLTLKVDAGSFTVTSTFGGTQNTVNFMSLNQKGPTYGAETPSFVIYHGIVRDIIHQEPEWSGGIGGCPNVYGHIVLTLPANANYYTYELRLMFVNSTQPRTITDITLLQATATITQNQWGVQWAKNMTEDGIQGGNPTINYSSGFYYNSSNGWQHHWSEFVGNNHGFGIMMTTAQNLQLYAMDYILGNQTGGINVMDSINGNSQTLTLQLKPVSLRPVSFTDPHDLIWSGAIATFDGQNPIYPDTGGTNGLWTTIEQPLNVTVITKS